MKPPAKRIAQCALLSAIALILGFIENLIPLPTPVPGLKIGLANIVTLFALYRLSPADAFAVVLTRCLLSALLFGGVAQLPFSLGGGLCALLVMAGVRKFSCFSEFGVGIAGAAAHNTAQVSIAAAMYSTPGLFLYLAPLLPASIITGFAVAMVFRFFHRALPR